ncbi:hypothetical protein HanHA89_Chr12g0453741 [Helianthus annuus]|nr:hypothetical protein HanHA89_Chr12g0453741 [Helianthus annuus]
MMADLYIHHCLHFASVMEPTESLADADASDTPNTTFDNPTNTSGDDNTCDNSNS